MALHKLKTPRIDVGTTLRASPPLRRLQVSLQDLILIALEAYTKTHGQSYALTTLHYVSDEKHAGKFCMHFDGLVKELEANANIPIQLTLNVRVGGDEIQCSEP